MSSPESDTSRGSDSLKIDTTRSGSDSLKTGTRRARLVTPSSPSPRMHLGMPRPPRVVLPGHTLHLIQRGNDRKPCFVDDEDRARYLATLLYASERARCDVHAYVLMTNHAHLLVTAGEASAPSRMMQALGRNYVRHFNERYGRTGTLWEGRYRSSLIDSERYFLQCSVYIETNPVRAGIVNRPDEYRWSSFGSNAGGQPDALVRRHPVYLALGRWGSTRREAYRALFATPLEPPTLEAIRLATNKGCVLGFDDSRSELEQTLGRSLSHAKHGGSRRHRASPEE
jgi:REP-associated tyrosine transposase